MSTELKYTRRNFWVAIYRSNKDLSSLFNIGKKQAFENARKLFDMGVAIAQINPEEIRLALFIYRKKPIRFDILKYRLDGFYITAPKNSPRDLYQAYKNKYSDIEIFRIDKNTAMYECPIDDVEDVYFSKLDDIFTGD